MGGSSRFVSVMLPATAMLWLGATVPPATAGGCADYKPEAVCNKQGEYDPNPRAPGLYSCRWQETPAPATCVRFAELPRAMAVSNLKPGDKGDGVLGLQILLNSKGFALSNDGKFGVQTMLTLAKFQSQAGIEPTGKLDERTLEALKK